MERNIINEYFGTIIHDLLELVPLWESKAGYEDFGGAHLEELRIAEDYFSELGLDVQLCYGLTKLVIIVNGNEIGNDYVAKIPFLGMNYDYCAEEVNIYENLAAEDSEFLSLFCECWYGGEFKHDDTIIKYYIMERADADSNTFDEKSYKSWLEENGEEDEFGWSEPDEQLYYLLVSEVGEELADEVVGILDHYDINDIHDGNVGFVGGEMRFIDYSGFRG